MKAKSPADSSGRKKDSRNCPSPLEAGPFEAEEARKSQPSELQKQHCFSQDQKTRPHNYHAPTTAGIQKRPLLKNSLRNKRETIFSNGGAPDNHPISFQDGTEAGSTVEQLPLSSAQDSRINPEQLSILNGGFNLKPKGAEKRVRLDLSPCDSSQLLPKIKKDKRRRSKRKQKHLFSQSQERERDFDTFIPLKDMNLKEPMSKRVGIPAAQPRPKQWRIAGKESIGSSERQSHEGRRFSYRKNPRLPPSLKDHFSTHEADHLPDKSVQNKNVFSPIQMFKSKEGTVKIPTLPSERTSSQQANLFSQQQNRRKYITGNKVVERTQTTNKQFRTLYQSADMGANKKFKAPPVLQTGFPLSLASQANKSSEPHVNESTIMTPASGESAELFSGSLPFSAQDETIFSGPSSDVGNKNSALAHHPVQIKQFRYPKQLPKALEPLKNRDYQASRKFEHQPAGKVCSRNSRHKNKLQEQFIQIKNEILQRQEAYQLPKGSKTVSNSYSFKKRSSAVIERANSLKKEQEPLQPILTKSSARSKPVDAKGDTSSQIEGGEGQPSKRESESMSDTFQNDIIKRSFNNSRNNDVRSPDRLDDSIWVDPKEDEESVLRSSPRKISPGRMKSSRRRPAELQLEEDTLRIKRQLRTLDESTLREQTALREESSRVETSPEQVANLNEAVKEEDDIFENSFEQQHRSTMKKMKRSSKFLPPAKPAQGPKPTVHHPSPPQFETQDNWNDRPSFKVKLRKANLRKMASGNSHFSNIIAAASRKRQPTIDSSVLFGEQIKKAPLQKEKRYIYVSKQTLNSQDSTDQKKLNRDIAADLKKGRFNNISKSSSLEGSREREKQLPTQPTTQVGSIPTHFFMKNQPKPKQESIFRLEGRPDLRHLQEHRHRPIARFISEATAQEPVARTTLGEDSLKLMLEPSQSSKPQVGLLNQTSFDGSPVRNLAIGHFQTMQQSSKQPLASQPNESMFISKEDLLNKKRGQIYSRVVEEKEICQHVSRILNASMASSSNSIRPSLQDLKKASKEEIIRKSSRGRAPKQRQQALLEDSQQSLLANVELKHIQSVGLNSQQPREGIIDSMKQRVQLKQTSQDHPLRVNRGGGASKDELDFMQYDSQNNPIMTNDQLLMERFLDGGDRPHPAFIFQHIGSTDYLQSLDQMDEEDSDKPLTREQIKAIQRVSAGNSLKLTAAFEHKVKQIKRSLGVKGFVPTKLHQLSVESSRFVETSRHGSPLASKSKFLEQRQSKLTVSKQEASPKEEAPNPMSLYLLGGLGKVKQIKPVMTSARKEVVEAKKQQRIAQEELEKKKRKESRQSGVTQVTLLLD